MAKVFYRYFKGLQAMTSLFNRMKIDNVITFFGEDEADDINIDFEGIEEALFGSINDDIKLHRVKKHYDHPYVFKVNPYTYRLFVPKSLANIKELEETNINGDDYITTYKRYHIDGKFKVRDYYSSKFKLDESGVAVNIPIDYQPTEKKAKRDELMAQIVKVCPSINLSDYYLECILNHFNITPKNV